jgi:hypothetical protein
VHRHLEWMNVAEAFGAGTNAKILAERLLAADDPVLAHRLLRRYAKVATLLASVHRCIEDPAQRAWLEQLVLKDTKRDVEAIAPYEIAHRFYAHVRKTCRRTAG